MTPAAALDAVLAPLPRVALGTWPTPLVPLRRLGDALGVDLWMKRDDCSGLALGGNKARKLEFVLGAAMAAGARTIVTVGPMTSNHTMMTAAAGRRLGLDVHVVLGGTLPAVAIGNLGLTRLLRAQVHVTPLDTNAPTDVQLAASRALTQRLVDEHGAWFVPPGATMPASVPGYVSCVAEILGQQQGRWDFDDVIVAYGTGSTAAGVLAGLALAGLRSTLHAIAVSSVEAMQRFGAQSPQDLAREAAAHYGWTLAADVLDAGCTWLRDPQEPGYGIVSVASDEAMRRMAEDEGYLLDPTYTAKAVAALLAMARDGRLARGRRVLFVHTGGLSTTAASSRA